MNYKDGAFTPQWPKGVFDMHPRCKPTHIVVDYVSDKCDAIDAIRYCMGGQVKQADKAYLDELIEQANKGRRALVELFRLVPDDIQVSCRDEEQYGRKAGSWGPLKSYKDISYRIRPCDFPLEKIGSWEIGVSDDKSHLTIGCMSFNLSQLQHALFKLCVQEEPFMDVNVGDPERPQYRIFASRRGIRVGENSLKWGEAEKLYGAIKEWNRRK